MNFIVWYSFYNSFGSHTSISFVGDYLEYNMPNFGDGIKEFEITLSFSYSTTPRKTLEDSHKKFHEYLKTLPKCTFYRHKKKVLLSFQAKFATGLEIEKSQKLSKQINPDWVYQILNEILLNLPIIKAKLKRTNDFDFETFQQYLKTKLESLPKTLDELEKLEKIYSDYRKARFAKLDEWEKLGIDWSDYHKNARNIINYPFLWDLVDEFSPNGNDTGADVLDLFKNWNKRNKNKSAIIFLKNILSQWEVDINSPYTSEYSSQTFFQTVVGLAFASAKIRGYCETQLYDMAILAIDKCLESVKTDVNWEYLQEFEEKQSIVKKVLRTMPNYL